MRFVLPLSCLAILALANAPLSAAPIDDANAGVVAAQNGKYDDAIMLFTNAINSDGLDLHDRAQAYSYRGIAKATTGDYDGAQEDLNSSVVLDSDFNGSAYAFRGYFRLVRGQSKEAADDLAKSAGLRLWHYNVLWLYLARLKGGIADEGPHALAANAAIIDAQRGADGSYGLARWPGPVVKLLMGEGTEASVRTAAMQGDPAKLAERVCDVDFYLAEVDLAHNDAAAAKKKLQAALDKCPFASFERMGAAAELARLK